MERAVRVATVLSVALLIAAWLCAARTVHPGWPGMTLAGLAATLAATAYAFVVRPVPGILRGFGKGKVAVQSLDDWTEYQYGVPFEKSSAEQQSEALNHYRVGLRLFPARPQDAGKKAGFPQWVLMLVTFCSFVTLSEAMHGWKRLLLFLAMYGWLALCTWVSRRFETTRAAESLMRA